jgi:DNA-binding FrmR family transcriptional regulator
MTEDNMLAARSESDSLAELDARAFEEELDLFARGNAFSKGSGGDKERSDGNPPKYKVAKKDPPPRYDGPPSPIHFESPGTNYANNHKSPATGGGRSRRSFDEEDELFARSNRAMGQVQGIVKGFGGNHHRRALDGEGELFTRSNRAMGQVQGIVKGFGGNHHRRALDEEAELSARYNPAMGNGFGNGGPIKPGIKVFGGNHHRRALDEEAELSARYNPAMGNGFGNGGPIKPGIKVLGGNHHFQ